MLQNDVNNELCQTEEVRSQIVVENRPLLKQTDTNFNLQKKILSFIKNHYPVYSRYWESEAEKLYKESSDSDEDEIIQGQFFIKARDISMGFFDTPSFPWHGHSLEDFVLLDNELQTALSAFEECNTDIAATKLMRKYRQVYLAYYRNPIRIAQTEKGYELLRDGRHRLWVAQLHNSYLPVWVVKYENTKSVPLEKYKKALAYGDWRFGGLYEEFSR